MFYKLTVNANITMAVEINVVHWNSRHLTMSWVPKQCCRTYSAGAFYKGGHDKNSCFKSFLNIKRNMVSQLYLLTHLIPSKIAPLAACVLKSHKILPYWRVQSTVTTAVNWQKTFSFSLSLHLYCILCCFLLGVQWHLNIKVWLSTKMLMLSECKKRKKKKSHQWLYVLQEPAYHCFRVISS